MTNQVQMFSLPTLPMPQFPTRLKEIAFHHRLLFGSDQLTAKRARARVRIKNNSMNSAERLQGLLLAEDWHAKDVFKGRAKRNAYLCMCSYYSWHHHIRTVRAEKRNQNKKQDKVFVCAKEALSFGLLLKELVDKVRGLLVEIYAFDIQSYWP